MSKSTSKQRKKLSQSVEAQVLTESRRRCCFCYYLDNKSTANDQGQIAHIDRNRSNNQESNLAYLCIPHHDKYDSTTSQSKGLTPGELLYAKKELLAYLANDKPSSNDVYRLTLTLEARLASYTQEEQEHLLGTLLPSLVQAAIVGSAEIHDGRRRVFVELSAKEAAQLCKSFNDRRLPPDISNIAITAPSKRQVVIGKMYDEQQCGVSGQQATETVWSHDSAAYFDGAREVPLDEAKCGLYVKRYGKNTEERYTIIVVTSIRDDTSVVYGAFRVEHRTIHVPESSHPLQVLKAFLEVFGVEVSLPGIGTSNLFFSGTLTVPANIVSVSKLFHYIGRRATVNGAESYAMVAYLRKSTIVPVVDIYITIFFAVDRYLKSIRRR